MMSNITIINRTNNEENIYNNEECRNNSNGNKKPIKKNHKVNPNEIKVPLYLPADLNENTANEILKVLAETKFNKISIPVGTYRCLIDYNVDESDNRVCTIGYIRNYNIKNNEFTVVIFSKFMDFVKSMKESAIELTFTNYKDKLGTITKFNIIPVVYENEEDNEPEIVDDEDEVVTTEE